MEQSAELRLQRLHPAERLRCLEACQCLARGSRSGLIAHLPIFAATVGAFGNIQRDADECPLELIAERCATRAERRKIGRKPTNQLKGPEPTSPLFAHSKEPSDARNWRK